jgi:phosphatidylethanolamine/phosphatidyl-N-methylethanolamine N-methyltransferase
MRQRLAFALGYLRSPRRVGAIAPASRALAQAIQQEVTRSETRILLEVGAGTGAITRALLPLQSQVERFVAVERDPGFAHLLGVRFPGLDVRNLCASQLADLSLDTHGPITIVSSLPLLSMPREEVARCTQAMLAMLSQHPGSRLIQYTYAAPHMRPIKQIPHGWRWRRIESVWINLPPATVWSLEQAPTRSHPLH